ncbi:hypothetical protein J2S43_001124 [Catenuloplanes nepalensis]|uniref:Uncharacterized protein n=1 Tax=Catenuloplanes nepalensis TaxID=587533 RepID=A0ABT9MMG9_9ACTN|nr:hypothetical protein [Catenuloplanes nepalensis]
MWAFDPRSETAVRELCTSVYGTDGSDNDQPRVTALWTTRARCAITA